MSTVKQRAGDDPLKSNAGYLRAIKVAEATRGEPFTAQERRYTARLFAKMSRDHEAAREAGGHGRTIVAFFSSVKLRASAGTTGKTKKGVVQAMVRRYAAACRSLAWMATGNSRRRFLEQAALAEGVTDEAGTRWLTASATELAQHPDLQRMLKRLRDIDPTIPSLTAASSGGRPPKIAEGGAALLLAAWWYRTTGALPSRGSNSSFARAVRAACVGMGIAMPSEDAIRKAVSSVREQTMEGVSSSES